ncbi:MAG: DEAD/DEAH box helicase [Candidatus Lokiarchaeota archaeon]|nr:DEAD/DEAH box helicase [Candidatus Lokiarchaeota archaeon]
MVNKKLHKKYIKPEWLRDNLSHEYLLPHQAAFCVDWYGIEEFKDEKFEYKNENGNTKNVKVKNFGSNYFIVAGTGTGKSLIAHIAMAFTLHEKGGSVIYSGNYKALINEQYEEVKELFRGQKFKIRRKTGDFSSRGIEDLGRYDVVLTTYEACEQILQNRPGWIKKVNLIVIDEIHTVGDEDRGPILESVIAMALSLNIPLVFLSATVGDQADIETFARNLNATLIDAHDFRLVPLEKFVLYENKAYYDNSKKHKLIERSRGRFEATSSTIGAMRNFALWVLFSRAKKAKELKTKIPQILCFVRSRNAAVNNSERLVKRIKELLDMSTIEKKFDFNPIDLDEIEEIETPTSNIVLADILKETIPYRVAFHSSSLTLDWRNYVEKLFKLGYIRVIWSTPTLSAGVNLPAKYTLIYPQIAMRDLQINEYKQSIGRAGRPKYDRIGYGGIVVLKKRDLPTKEDNIAWYFDKYVNADPETIYSSMLMIESHEKKKLEKQKKKITGDMMKEYLDRGKLRTHPNFFAFILKLISGDYAKNTRSIIDFCERNLFIFRQFPELPVADLIAESIDVLLDPYKVISGNYFGQMSYQKALGKSFPLIDKISDSEFSVRPLGKLSIKTYLRPLSASMCASLATNDDIQYRLFINKNENILAKKLAYFIGLTPDFYSSVSIPSGSLIPLLNEYDNDICDESFLLDSDFIRLDPSSCYGKYGRPSLYALYNSTNQLQIKSFISWWVSLIAEEWINETKMRKIEEKFNISFGNYQNYFGQNGVYVWLSQAASLIAMHFKNKKLYQQLSLLSKRIEKGCKTEILPLTYLKEVGRDRGRQLFDLGYKTIESIAKADPISISKVKGLSIKRSENIIKQADRIVKIKNSRS